MAQTKIMYYPNGNKAFKGRMIQAWPAVELKDMIPAVPQVNYNDYSPTGSNEITRLTHLLPEAVYDGQCTFYRQDGSKWYSGKYRYGVKQGKFQYWYANGKLAAVQYYKNGMADGHWQIWDSTGLPQTSYHYRAIPDTMLNMMTQYLKAMMTGDRYSRSQGKDSAMSSFISRRLQDQLSWGIYRAYEERLSLFQSFFDDNLFPKALWDGNFEAWKAGRPYMIFAFKDNRPDGIWKLWSADTLVFEMHLQNDSVVSIKDYARPETNSQYSDYTQSQLERRDKFLKQMQDAINTGQDDPNAIDAGLHPTPAEQSSGKTVGLPPGNDDKGRQSPEADSQKVFRFVQQQAEFPGGTSQMSRFIKEHLQYPEEARRNNIQGKVVVEFVITESGKIDTGSIQLRKKVAPLIDAEALRIIKLMPDWAPAKNNGKPVKSYFVLPMTFSL